MGTKPGVLGKGSADYIFFSRAIYSGERRVACVCGIIMKTKKPLNERQLVNLLIKALKKNSPGIYIHVDRDSGNMRHTSSGWDFLAVWNGRTVFCECKIGKGKLTDWQKLTQLEIQKAKGKYKVLRFKTNLADTVSLNDDIFALLIQDANGEWLTH